MKKVFVFDFDGTFYTGKDVFKWSPFYIETHRRKFLPNVSDNVYNEICEKYPDFIKAVSGRQLAIQVYKIKADYPQYNIDMNSFVKVQQDYIYDICLANAHMVDREAIKNLCEKYPVYIVSNSSQNHLKHYMKVLDVDYSWFKGVYSNQFEQFDPTKQHYYQEIIEAEKIQPNQLYVFGDSKNSDLEPAYNIGANAFLVEDAHKIKIMIEELN